jgi:pimeloyl-ACP methyl ester carboxylesterase
MKRHPWHAIRSTVSTRSLHGFNTPKLAREYFYSPHTPESDVVRYVARLEEEFTGRITLDMALLDRPKPERVTTPLLVLGAECDGCFRQEEVRATARAYHTEAEIFPSMGHNMMVEPGWTAVAERIHGWLETRDLGLDRGGSDQQAASQ